MCIDDCSVSIYDGYCYVGVGCCGFCVVWLYECGLGRFDGDVYIFVVIGGVGKEWVVEFRCCLGFVGVGWEEGLGNVFVICIC